MRVLKLVLEKISPHSLWLLSTIMDMSNSILKSSELLFQLVIYLQVSRLIISVVAVSFKK